MSGNIDPQQLPYRPCVGIMLINAQGLVWVGNRINNTEAVTGETFTWQMPQGGIDEGEKPRVAAFREMKEEIGTDKAEVLGKSEGWITYDLPAELVGKALKGKYRGQKQKWFALRFTGTDADFDLTADAHQEFSEWRWAHVDELIALVVPFKRGVYKEVVAQLGHFAAPA
ncbi:MAG: RNA pyrophosphohydrolase [Parvibaculaceae bacterium]|nr:RNA pyrophosphohydrolase [Parvibaculaceae bacterium]